MKLKLVYFCGLFLIIAPFILAYVRSPARSVSGRALFAKKTKRGNSTPTTSKIPLVSTKVGTTTSKGKKGDIRVRLNEDVKNVGKKNEVLFVSGAMFNNVLGPQKKAIRVTDEENAANIAKNLEDTKAAEDAAEVMKTKIEGMNDAVIERNVGPDGTLFGVVTGKHILEHLKAAKIDVPPKAEVKKICILDESGSIGECLDGVEAKKSGNYIAKVKLNEKVALASFRFLVQPGSK